MGHSFLDVLAEVAAQKWEEERAKGEGNRGLKFISEENSRMSLTQSESKKIVSATEIDFLGMKKDELQLGPILLMLACLKSCTAKKTQKEKVTSFKTETTGFTYLNEMIPRKKRSVIKRKKPEFDGVSVPGFENFHLRELNKSRKRCFPSEGKDKQGAITNPVKKKQKKVFDLETPSDLPVEVRNKIQELGGSELKLVIQKILFSSDLNPNNGRFSIPENQIREDFLTEGERVILDKRQGEKVCGMEVLVLDPRLEEFNLKLKKWNMDKTDVFNLTHKWNEILNENKDRLCLHDLVQLWSFRRSSNQLCFALVKV